MLPVAILAGGLATRLRPLTEKIPKALIDINGEPFITKQLQYLKQQGVERVVLCVGYLCEQIQEIVGDGKNFQLEIDYVFDGDILKGTGGALQNALPLLGDAFFVLYGDSFLPVNFAEIEKDFFKQQKLALMTVLKNKNQWDKSNVLFEAGTLQEYNKKAPHPEMHYIDYGLGILSKEVFDREHREIPFDLADLYHTLSLQNKLAGYEVFERFYEIGSLQGLAETREYFLKGETVWRMQNSI